MNISKKDIIGLLVFTIVVGAAMYIKRSGHFGSFGFDASEIVLVIVLIAVSVNDHKRSQKY